MIIPQTKFVFDRKHTASNTKKGSIDLRITYNRKQKFISTGVKCYPGQWDLRNECIRSLDCQEDNANLIKIRKKALKIIGDMVDEDNIDLNAIPTLLKQKQVSMTFEDFIYKRIKDRQVTDSTKKAYHVFFSRFCGWGKMKFFRDITEANIHLWDKYLHGFRWEELDGYGQKVMRCYSQASIGSMHKNLKIFINDAMVEGYVKENPYTTKRIRIDKGRTRIEEFLTKEELDRIISAKMPTRPVEEARDLFVFQSLTGLSYADLMEFDFTKTRLNGEYRIYKDVRVKTGVEFVFILTSQGEDILKKYNYHLPKLPNQKYNAKLKIVADAAGIEKNLTSHVGRRTAGSVWLNQGIPIEVVSRCLGHSNILITQKAYARILDSTVINAFATHLEKK